MIKNATVAKQISDLMLDISSRINQSVESTESLCAPVECAAYRRAATEILVTIQQELLNPLYAEHPSLRPAGWVRVARRPADSRTLGGIIQPV